MIFSKNANFFSANVIAYYSSSIFEQSGFSTLSALGASMGFGVINFLFAIPAVYTIDTFGRRNLLPTTPPPMPHRGSPTRPSRPDASPPASIPPELCTLLVRGLCRLPIPPRPTHYTRAIWACPPQQQQHGFPIPSSPLHGLPSWLPSNHKVLSDGMPPGMLSVGGSYCYSCCTCFVPCNNFTKERMLI